MAGAAQASNVGARFVHYATLDNAYGGATQIRHPLTDGKPNAIVHVTQNWNPPGTTGVSNDKVIGVIYYNGQWSIFNEDDSYIPRGSAFNIWIPPVDASSFVHTATPGNITGHFTAIDNPLINNDPGAHFQVTHNYNPGGGGGYYNNSVIGVFYNYGLSKWVIFNQDYAAIPPGSFFNVTVLPPGPTTATHAASALNITGNWTTIDHPLANNNPNAIVSVTQNLTAYPFGGVFNDHAIGVWYTGSRWVIFNQDYAPMPENAFFDISVPRSESSLFVHTADPGNSFNQMTFIDNPLTNNNPNAIVYATQNWNPGGIGGVFNNHPLGVLYNYSRSKWAIFNQDIAAMPGGASFNVSIPTVDASIFVHGATAENITGNSTLIDNPVTNGSPDAIIHVTQNWDPSGIGGVYNDHLIGVWYSSGAGKWLIFNQDLAAMPVGASFNVSIPAIEPATFVHTAAAWNISGNSTVVHHPLTDGNPDAIVLLTQNFNPPGGAIGVYNDHQIGVYYTGNGWSIFNQDNAPIPEGASFNVTVVDPPFFSDGFETGDVSHWSVSTP